MSEAVRPNLAPSGEITPKITPEIVAEHGLSEAEYDRVIEVLGREPNLLELGIDADEDGPPPEIKATRKF